MPTIDTFGMPTRPANATCPVCGVGMLVRKFDYAHGHMNRITCPVASCSYDVSDREFRASMTEVLTEVCPDCGEPLVRKTKDIDSKFMGWVACQDESCPFEMEYRTFRAGLTP